MKTSLAEKKYKLKIKKLETENKKIRRLEKRNILLRKKLLAKKQAIKSKVRKAQQQIKERKRKEKTRIKFKIDSGDNEKDIKIFTNIISDLIRRSSRKKIPFEYKVKPGCLDVELIFRIIEGVGIGVVGGLIVYVITRKMNRREITKRWLDPNAREEVALAMHVRNNRSFRAIEFQEDFRINGQWATRFIISDDDGAQYEYTVGEDGMRRRRNLS